ncbi:glutamate 5-kinase [Plasticicumulans acidivorans]|uniref:Glutamate 5-kinase n=1 Tax=Plasticicumulans acidivorans TaxID=886464 RepID=A0A317MS83_9GAMM|nr:glutamate 5-kinase [Plasticicumulans acidivorans]PWV59304.1 glutamate 5-kinase [Plasticicumulans acidivorans]
MTCDRVALGQARRWVVKIGSAMVTDEGRGLDAHAIDAWVAQLAGLHREGRDVIIVSSGAVAEGMRRLGWSVRPQALHELQAAAAVGQMGLAQAWEAAFQREGIRTAQILLTHDDVRNRQRYLNARGTLRTLIGLGVIPVVNENDTVAFEEVRFGDNDTLGALVSNLIEAELYVILTDQKGLFDRDPRSNPDAVFISEASAGAPELEDMAGGGSSGALGRGGMLTKVRAAAKAARSGTSTILAWGREHEVLRRIKRGEALGTLLHADQAPDTARKQWLAVQMQVRGHLHLDAGAVHALCECGKSLLPVGVRGVDGDFQRGELVACLGPDGVEVARGLINYSAADTARIMGKSTSAIEHMVGYVDVRELIHRDDLVLV